MKNTLQLVWFVDRRKVTSHVPMWMAIGMFLLVTTLLTACGGSTTGQQGTATTVTTSTATATGEAANPTATPTLGPLKPTVPLTAIRMLDTMHGWALTATEVLKTADGGSTWEDVSPTNNPLKTSGEADFMDAQHAWIAIPPGQTSSGTLSGSIKVLYTVDGAAHWQVATIIDVAAVGTDRPHFINALDGWLEVGTGAALSHESVDIFSTTNGGQTWLKVASAGPNSSSGLSFDGDKTGLSFQDAFNGWATATTPATDHAWLYVTHDGGKTWQSQSLPTLPGLTNVEYDTTPPVFFGNEGLLPVQVNTATLRGIDLYVTHDGGSHWSPTELTTFASTNVYILDMHHAWATVESIVYATNNGGQSWVKQGTAPDTVAGMSFVDENNGWAIGYINDTTPLLLHTIDGGRSWQVIHFVIRG